VVPPAFDEAGFCRHVEEYDIDLGCSRVVIDERPAAFALVGRRDTEAWIGGMGTVAARRRLGLGERALAAALEAAFARGCHVVWLEVLEDNQAAFALYVKLGFQLMRDLIVWSLPAMSRVNEGDSGGAADLGAAADLGDVADLGDAAYLGAGADLAEVADLTQARAWITANRTSREPWQRADATIDRMLEGGSELRAVAVARRGERAAAVIFRDDEANVSALQLAALDDRSAARALTAAAGGRELRFSNLPLDEPASRALEQLGARQVARQHELRLSLG
jgi:Acetyltransferase (GNAT) family